MKLRTVVLFVALLAVLASCALYAQTIRKTSVMPTSPASGSEMFVAYCAACHGRDAKGDGPAASALKPAPADLTKLAARNGGKFPELKVYATIQGDPDTPAHGSREMPVWGAIFQSLSTGNQGEVQMRITNLTAYIKTLQTK